MKLTEAKLKEMILEALKKKYDGTRFVDFGIPTPDEKLKADLGDETYGKIQSLDKNQRDIMKQTFDPNYPRDLNQETIQSFMESHGFDLERQELEDFGFGLFMHEFYMKGNESLSIDYRLKTFKNLPNKKYIHFSYQHNDSSIYNSKSTRDNGSIEILSMFDYDMGEYYDPNEEDIETMSSLVIGRIKNDLEKILDK